MGQLRTANKRHNRMMTKAVAAARPAEPPVAKAAKSNVAA